MNDFKLDSRPNIKSGFKAPDSYFESLTDRVMLNLPMPEVKVIPLYRRRPVWLTSAAAALVLSFSLMLSKDVAATPVLPSDAITEDYILNQSGISTDDILANVDAKDLQALNVELIDVSDEEIEANINLDDVYYQTN
jgi:hypothetical protein